MGIRERLQARDARFISFADLLAAVAEAENVPEQTAAVGLCDSGVFSRVGTYLRVHGYGDITEGGDDALNYEIDCAVHGSTHSFLRDVAQSELNTGEVGFLCEEIAPALAAVEIAVPDRLRGWLDLSASGEEGVAESTSPKAERSLTTFIARQWITLTDTSRLLVEHNSGTQYDEWWDALADAADSQQIQSGSWGMERGEQPLLHDDIRAWCSSYGYVWPVPLPGARKPDAPVDDSEMRDALDRAQARIAELERERAELLKKIEATTKTVEATSINSPTLQRILDAMAQYPAWRASQSREPNLKAVLGWLQGTKKNPSRVEYVAHHVIAEHFGLRN